MNCWPCLWDCGLRRELGTPITAVRVVRIHLVDGDEVYQHIYRQERWDKSALTRCAPRSTPLRLPLRHNRSLPAPSRLLPPLTSPSRALGTLAKLTSVTGITVFKASDCGRLGRQAADHPWSALRVVKSYRKDCPTAKVLLEAKAAALLPKRYQISLSKLSTEKGG